MVVVMFADVVARVPVTLDGAVAYTQWQEAIGAIVDYLIQFSGFEPSNKVTILTILALLIQIYVGSMLLGVLDLV
ncbi:hypothetical protein HanRHA438_Chr08g0372661 [Helianthus annuus]|uniref:Uncharacterized protein n=1 Tax=Helianthus annuus TaxID=4232 RepID=A0A9K3IHL4_HELAN|nr:hypothetical protein HanXRQr2_Chr08g0360691 [Helianthus annuus]KAJ0548937.1 hypothetical protein HanIR_Chr08g0389461 [Helianthus annuus]KAJ0555149.1 hypothetical protein HanHA89_Chr08g0316391 [Helianthus annuus]KAJ0720718.1 hypothetical protein HanLR1_Chr08g0296771 [Helianthus annuus]KAJ0723900.1 hypothetical protein HanOQP8_Chr08g0303811 [Helianthus annuus]